MLEDFTHLEVFNHPKVRLAKKSSVEKLKIAIGTVEFWDNLFKRYNVKIALNLPPIGMKIAQLAKVNTQTLAISKFGKRLYWTSNSNNEPDNLQKLFKKNKKPKLLRFVPEKPQFNHMMLRKNDIMAFTLYNTVKLSLTKLLQRLYGQMKGYRKVQICMPSLSLNTFGGEERIIFFLRKTLI